MKTIEVIVNPEGKTNIQTKGFAGTSCREASRFLEQVLGTQSQEQLTAEFHHVNQFNRINISGRDRFLSRYGHHGSEQCGSGAGSEFLEAPHRKA